MENIAETLPHNIQENIQRYRADGEDYVRQNPTKTALVAMGVGFLLAQLPLRWMCERHGRSRSNRTLGGCG
jgi:ElaB/YqjD/DUF883 family membrane-anchored ribosome-binding protein